MTEPVNGRTKEEFRELCEGGAQNATVCKVRSSSTVEVGKMYYSDRVLRSVKAAPNVLRVTLKYAKVLQ